MKVEAELFRDRVLLSFDLAEDPTEDDVPIPALQFRGTENEGPANVRLTEAIRTRMKDYGEDERVAELAIVQTDTGLRLWEEARAERMER